MLKTVLSDGVTPGNMHTQKRPKNTTFKIEFKNTLIISMYEISYLWYHNINSIEAL